jgi:hypothetical protein
MTWHVGLSLGEPRAQVARKREKGREKGEKAEKGAVVQWHYLKRNNCRINRIEVG